MISGHLLSQSAIRLVASCALSVSLLLSVPLYAQSSGFRAIHAADVDSNAEARDASNGEAASAKLSDDISRTPEHSTFSDSCAANAGCAELFVPASRLSPFVAETLGSEPPDHATDTSHPVVVVAPNSKPAKSQSPFYYKNKLEFSFDGGWLPINIPFVFDVFLGDGYTMTNLRYTLVPIIGSVRWQINDVGGPWIFRGNWDLECSGAVVLIPRGPETHYSAWILGFRRNFVPRRGRVAPYFDGRVGLGGINAKAPAGVLYAQGQNFTFTLNMGSGVRYNLSPRYSLTAGLNWMHISNLYLSQPQFANYGINVYGPMFGMTVRLGRLGRHHQE